MLINSLSHVRSAFWLNDGRWRQWEAYDCVNIDSVHNDGERHIPYIFIFPNSTISKLYAWAKYQASNGMIHEQLRCGCMTMSDQSPRVEYGCGRTMSDVSSMFIVYLLELLTWHDDPYSQQVVRDLYNASKKAAQWHMSVSTAEGIPIHMVDTYDVLRLESYPYDTYSGSFHLLAMKAAETLAYAMGDIEFAETCQKAFITGQQALDRLLWNETARYYNAYTLQTETDGIDKADTDPLGAIMTDTFYSQVLAYSLGLGTLVQNETRLKLHMKAELEHNDSPYGMLVLTGRHPYPGPYTDNAVWMMGNPNWATINMHLGEDVNQALQVGIKAMEHWRSVIHDEWNVVGIMGGLGYGADGMPYITSHYGYFMSSWHMVMALSGQKANMSEKSLTFDPKLDSLTDPPFVLPVLLPGVWGYLQNSRYQVGTDSKVSYSLVLHFGSLELSHLSVADCIHPDSSINIVTQQATSWSCSYT
ncbi:PREDICTED: uncharacterized protein LOC109591341 [Amphimedon queenslandica]|nr:PREDICTED: uncharacterized protein LOC109591341 [Amphimedon queenslandica]|eukprot:XP_019862650.1 PREDICTED: uncharacterized protein LOC109591341 [Amphimedon queenslandica]